MPNEKEKHEGSEVVELKGDLAEFRQALEDEIYKIKSSGMSTTLLYAGHQIESHGEGFWYCFRVEYLPTIPADTPCKLTIGKEQYDVTVISFEETAITIASKEQLPPSLGRARLENGATVLMERLIKCIEENAENENTAGSRMMHPQDSENHRIFSCSDWLSRSDNNEAQNAAIYSALTNDITYIWGPPGTGKTTVIGQIIEELYQRERSVLVVSHTNVAVDGAIKQAYKRIACESETLCPILRLGTPVKTLAEEVSMDAHKKVLGKELYEQERELNAQKTSLILRKGEIARLLSKEEWVQENHLETIHEGFQRISSFESEHNYLRQEKDNLEKRTEQEKEAHPEHAEFLSLSKTLKAKQEAYSSFCARACAEERLISELPGLIVYARDEIKKHDRYVVLKAQEEEYMSESFLRHEIEIANARIAALADEMNELSAAKRTAQEEISGYEKKGAMAKLFAGRAKISQAQDRLQYANTRLPKAQEEQNRQHQLILKYTKQLEELLFLQEEIKAVIPSETKEYWENEVQRLQTELSTAQKLQPELLAQKAKMEEDLADIQQRRDYAKAPFESISELERSTEEKQKKLEELTQLRNQQQAQCRKLLEEDIAHCELFFVCPSTEDDRELFAALCNCFETAKEELRSIDTNALRKEQTDIGNQFVDIYQALNVLREKLRQLEKQAIMRARIVGSTLAKSYLSENLRERKFDTVILDEASMASIPALWCASYLAEKNIVIVGDFLQLPPIVMSDTDMAKKWLGKDIFYHSGMIDCARRITAGKCPDYFVMLREQYRMEPDIAELSNMYYGEYRDEGLTTREGKDREAERNRFYEWYSGTRTKDHVHLVDTESLHAWVTGVPQGKGHSRLNCFSAAVDVDLAFKFLEKKLGSLDPQSAEPSEQAYVLIVAPYKPHIALINQHIQLEYQNRGFGAEKDLGYVRAGTIHSFQGSEADIVIFDLVVDEPHWKANLFMQDEEINASMRKMFNVAITRAKFKLFVVGNFSYCQKRAKDNALSALLVNLLEHRQKIDAKQLLPRIVYERRQDFTWDGHLTGQNVICKEDSFLEYLMADIQSFQHRLIVYSPFITADRLGLLLPAFADAIQAGKKIIVVTKALSERGKSESMYRKYEKALRDAGVNVIHKKGMHEKNIFVDNRAIWLGSLNSLSFNGTTGEIMHRFESRSMVSAYEKLFDIEPICGATENDYELKCPICGNEMLVKEGADGGVYWECSEGDYSRNVTQQYPVDGILRCKCGAPYVFSMKNEPRWVCSENPKHFQKMREGDLKLEKMLALIPTKKAENEVRQYFAKKRKERETEKKKTAPSKKQAASKRKKADSA